MAESCISSPTLTTTQVITTNVPVTLIEDITTSLPALITTYTLTPSCSQVGRTCVAAPTTVTSTIPGEIVTTGITSTTTTTSELTLTTTLFGSSCSGTVTDTNTGAGTGIGTGTGTGTGSRSRTPGSATGTTTSRSETTSTFISTQSDGRVVTSLVTITAAPVGVNDNDATGATGGNLKLGPIIGGVVGGVVVLIIVTLVTWYYLKKRATTKELDLLFDGDIKIKPHVEHGNHGPSEKVTKFETKIPQLEPQHQHQPTRQSYHDQYQQQQQQQQTGQVPQQQQERPKDHDDPRKEKKRLKKMYESTMTIANGIGNEINDAGPSRYNNSGSPPPSTSPNPNYPRQALPSVPTNTYYNPGSSSSNANVGHFVSGSIGHHHGQVPPVGYPYNQSTGHGSSVPVDPRLSQYSSVSSPGSSRPTSIENLNGRQDQHTHAGYYQSTTQVMYPNNPQVQIPGPPIVKVRQASGVGTSNAPRSEKHGQGYHLDGAQYQGGSSSTEPPPPAYMG